MDCPNPKRRSTVAGLPEDLLVEILARVPARSLYRFKCVAKAWRDLIADPLLRKKLPQTLQGFIYSDGDAYSLERDWRFINPLGKSVPFIDTSFAFLTKLPGVEKIVLLGSCNGLLLFGHRRVSDICNSLGYIVCNPAMPSSGWSPWPEGEAEEDENLLTQAAVQTHLIFDPAICPHFQLVQLWQECDSKLAGVHTYSSETGVWRSNEVGDWKQWGLDTFMPNFVPCPFNGMLYLKVDRFYRRRSAIVGVDGDGKTSWIIRWIAKRGFPDFIGHTHGNLYCISSDFDKYNMITQLSIWVLEDYQTEEWVLRYSVSILQLFGEMSCHFTSYRVGAIHPDCNLVFFVYKDCKLISYNMDSKEVNDVFTLGHVAICLPFHMFPTSQTCRFSKISTEFVSFDVLLRTFSIN